LRAGGTRDSKTRACRNISEASDGAGVLLALLFQYRRYDTAAKRVKARGGQILNGPIEVPDGSWIVQCTDPQDAMFALAGKLSYNTIGFLERIWPRPIAN
jgi:hypothetical protein